MGLYKSAQKLHRDKCLSEITDKPSLKARLIANLGLGSVSEGLDGTFVVANTSDGTKHLIFALSGATTSKTMTIISSHTNNRSLTLPDATDTLVGKATTDEFTNKTLTSMVVKTGLTASGSGSIDFSAHTGTFKTPTGAATFSGTGTFAANKNLLCASGTSLFDFSLGTGIFSTTTGAHSINGAVTFAANKGIAMAAGTGAMDFSNGTGVFKSTTGLNTMGGKMAVKTVATPVAATGAAGGVAGAAALGSANVVVISSDGATKGVKLLTGVAGDVIHIFNSSATAANLFAASGGTINGGSADAGCAIPASKGVIAICTAADTWTVHDMTARSGAAA